MKYSIKEIKAQKHESYCATPYTLLEDIHIVHTFDVVDLLSRYEEPFGDYDREMIYDMMVEELSKTLLKHISFKEYDYADILGKRKVFDAKFSFLSAEERGVLNNKISELEKELDTYNNHIEFLKNNLDNYEDELNRNEVWLKIKHSRLHISIAFNILLLGLITLSIIL